MKEFLIYDELASIRDRISRARAFREDSTGKPMDAKDLLIANIFCGAARVARSEFPADPEEIAITMQKVEETRSHVITNGPDFTQHPKFPHLNLALQTEEEISHYRDEFWMSLGDFEISYEPISKFDVQIPGIPSDHIFTHYTSPFEVHADKFPWGR